MTRTCFGSLVAAGPRLRRLVLASALIATLALPSVAAETTPAPDRTPVIDHSFMVVGCMGGLALGALSVIFPPVAAGMWMGGLGVMVIRAGLGCAYGGLAGMAASAARATVRWSEFEWRSWTGEPTSPLPIERPAGT